MEATEYEVPATECGWPEIVTDQIKSGETETRCPIET